MARPTFRNLTDSFEGWAYRNGFLRQLQRLERRQLIEVQSLKSGDRLYRLSKAGQFHVLGERNLEEQWKRRWDGRWRLVVFDVPESRRRTRDKLRQHLRLHGFGCLQNSVWITPDPVNAERALLAGGVVDVESLILLEARPCAGETEEEIVTGAWDFSEINRRYAVHRRLLARRPRVQLGSKAAAALFYRWLREERQAWLNAVELDPLLPSCLLPPDYHGIGAWRDRMRVMKEAGKQMRAFQAD